MTDLDIQIDVPDDDGLHSPVRVLNGNSWLPPWLKALAVVLLGVFLTLLVGAFIFGRTRGGGEPETASSSTSPIASAAASPAVEASLGAVQGWESFARNGDLATVAPYFDEAGPQFDLFRQGAPAAASPGPGAGGGLDFSARNISEARSGDLTTVSMDLVVTSARGQEIFPYDLVYRGDSTKAWTVVDRRSPGTVALPPPQPVVDAATQSWGIFTSAVAIDDAHGAATAVSGQTRLLASQVAAALDGDANSPPPTSPLANTELFRQLVERARATNSRDADRILLSLLNADQRRALVTGQLTTWTQVEPDRVVASLVVDGKPTAVVPFRAEEQGWAFDLVGALAASTGGKK
jgi:hypothetical protein